jgi:dolichyldiphosphatase
MPSTHSASITFMGVYLALISLAALDGGDPQSLSPYPPSSAAAHPLAVRVAWALCSLGFAGAVCWSRVRLGHHTPAQVVVGSSLGALTAIVAFRVWFGGDGGVRWSGLRPPAARLEAALEDVCWIALEAWQSGDWNALRRTLLDTDWKAVVLPNKSVIITTN